MKYLSCESVEYRLVLIAAGTAKKKGIALETLSNEAISKVKFDQTSLIFRKFPLMIISRTDVESD